MYMRVLLMIACVRTDEENGALLTACGAPCHCVSEVDWKRNTWLTAHAVHLSYRLTRRTLFKDILFKLFSFQERFR